jgi:hypothetical protein
MKKLIISTLLGACTLAANIPSFTDYNLQKNLKEFADTYKNNVDSNEKPVIGILT